MFTGNAWMLHLDADADLDVNHCLAYSEVCTVWCTESPAVRDLPDDSQVAKLYFDTIVNMITVTSVPSVLVTRPTYTAALAASKMATKIRFSEITSV